MEILWRVPRLTINRQVSKDSMKDIQIEQYCDGWTILVDNKRFTWNHNDEDLGTNSIKQLLEYIGHKVTIEECY